MKSVVLLIAILSGLSAEAMAAPIGDIRTVPNALESIAIESDLDFNSALIDEALQDEDQSEVVAAAPAIDEDTGEEEFSAVENEASGSLRVPEPPPFTTIAIGLGCLSLLALCLQGRRESRRARRRTFQNRPIIIGER
jgi:hypothetical protein